MPPCSVRTPFLRRLGYCCCWTFQYWCVRLSHRRVEYIVLYSLWNICVIQFFLNFDHLSYSKNCAITIYFVYGMFYYCMNFKLVLSFYMFAINFRIRRMVKVARKKLTATNILIRREFFLLQYLHVELDGESTDSTGAGSTYCNSRALAFSKIFIATCLVGIIINDHLDTQPTTSHCKSGDPKLLF
jgi:hypothetical protein